MAAVSRGLAAAIFISLFAGAAVAQSRSLDAEVERLIASKRLGNATVGICIRDVDNATSLAGVRENTPMTPASNMKILTSGAALMVLSPSFSFRTELIQDGDRLIVRGAGDPALADPEVLDSMSPRMTVGDVLDALAGAAAKAGITSARELVIDDRVFDRQFTHPSWAADKLDKGYAAQIAGLNFHANVLAVFPRPAQTIGAPPAYAIQPEAPWLRLENKARTVAAGKNSVWISRDGNTNRFTLHGDVRFPVQVGAEITVNDPPRFFGSILASELEKKGITIGAAPSAPGTEPAAVRLAEGADPVSGGRVIAAVSTPIAEVLHRCNTDSANLYAESLLKRIGNTVTHESGSWANGAAVLRMLLAQKLGPDAASSVIIADGSGLSREDAVSPGVMARWLEVLARDPQLCDTFTNSLAVPGKGTLKTRFQGARLKNQIFAKSGYINGVRSLSGYVVNPESGRRVAFSVIVNDVNDGQAAAAKELHEDVVRLCDRWLADRTDTPKQGG